MAKLKLTDADDTHRLNLAYQDMKELPDNIILHYSKTTFVLDLSHNKFSELRTLESFDNIHTLILDNNEIKSHTKFPPMPCLHTLWVNRNNITNLTTFVETLAQNFPKLKFLSMMNNPAAPSFFNGGTFQQFQDYRQYVISQLPVLETLDDQPVTWDERQEAERIYKQMFTTKQRTKKKTPDRKSKPRRHSSSRKSMEEETTGAIDTLPDLPDLTGET
ncbi:leucine-rich melanocyte differentiation-associated protein-like [Lytechinus pictus]|uniref:leucine-rich melanocyte differentiation-associated protein-like n=1 Tax=Lytechinus pictus TaxID=7653 RepID=UPI0030B9B3C4